ncbi:DUF1272 domain-containing protein, partial [Stenotrophomonas maltophilia]|uniref:DUF1272 domain-containing protein n=1 Tax=Stenotrophomonas maltophilia TaxID=40324 RepID=UPI0013DBF65F
MLDMKPSCEACNKELAPGSTAAWICSYECTFCADCARSRFRFECPNCAGELLRRPPRVGNGQVRPPASVPP